MHPITHIVSARRIVAIAAALALGSPAAAQLRIVNYNIAQLQGDLFSLQDVFAAAHADDKPGFAVPVGVFVFQEVLSTNVATLHNLVNAAAPHGITYALATYTNDDEDDYGGAQAMWYRTDLLTEIPAAHADIYTGAGRRGDRWRLQLANYASPHASVYIYSAHLKAEEGAANQDERLFGATNIRNNANALGAGVHIIYSGDYNLYSNGEPAYLHFLSAGNGQAFDPLGSGSWSGSANALKHTQSPRLNAGGGLVGGGLDDRFDFQISTFAMNDGAGLARMSVPFAYRTLGNDGNHYNTSINTGTNTYYPAQPALSNALAADLFVASDHVPVVVDYQIPAMMDGGMPVTFGRVIQGAAYSLAIDVTNPAPVVTQLGGDVLDFTATGSLALGGVQSGSVEPLGDVAIINLPLNTSVVGNITARATLTSSSQGVQPATMVLDSAGTIVRHANASFAPSTDVNTTTVSAEFDPDSGTHLISVPIHNFGYNALQALLDLDSVSAVSQPFAFLGGLQTGVGPSPATLDFRFDTDHTATGLHQQQVTITISDENLPGATNSQIVLSLRVTVGSDASCAADITGDTLVNVNDLLEVIVNWGDCPHAPLPCTADTNHDELVNVDDLLSVITSWGACP